MVTRYIAKQREQSQILIECEWHEEDVGELWEATKKHGVALGRGDQFMIQVISSVHSHAVCKLQCTILIMNFCFSTTSHYRHNTYVKLH